MKYFFDLHHLASLGLLLLDLIVQRYQVFRDAHLLHHELLDLVDKGSLNRQFLDQTTITLPAFLPGRSEIVLEVANLFWKKDDSFSRSIWKGSSPAMVVMNLL